MVAARHGAIVTEEQDEHGCSKPVGEDVTRPETVAKAAHRRGGQPAGREPPPRWTPARGKEMSDDKSGFKPAVDKLVREALAIEEEGAREAGALGYYARILVQATMPHSKPSESVFKRRNGAFSLTMLADPDVGLPYGTKPRLLLAWLTTEAVRTGERVLTLGPSLSAFMAELGLVPTGGRWGSITALREQTKRLFACSILTTHETEERWRMASVKIADKAELWWNPTQPAQTALWRSSVTLSETFFQEIISYPVPLDLRVLRALSKSPMALDIYGWLCYRSSYIRKPTTIPWEALQVQFGCGYPLTPRGKADFKGKFLSALNKVAVCYPEALKLTAEPHGLVVAMPAPHVPKR